MTQSKTAPPPMLLWAIWLFLFSGCIGYPFLLGNGWTAGTNGLESLPFYVYLLSYGNILVSCGIRWVLLPRLKNMQNIFPVAVIGMALAESLVFLGIFLVGTDYPETQRQFYLLGILGVGQYLPLYTKNVSEI